MSKDWKGITWRFGPMHTQVMLGTARPAWSSPADEVFSRMDSVLGSKKTFKRLKSRIEEDQEIEEAGEGKGKQKERRCILYTHQLPVTNVTITRCKHDSAILNLRKFNNQITKGDWNPTECAFQPRKGWSYKSVIERKPTFTNLWKLNITLLST